MSVDDQDNDVTWSEEPEEDFSEIFGFDFDAEDGVDRSGLRALINSALVSHRRLPMLDVIFDHTSRRMSTSLRQLTDDNVEVALDDVTSTRFGDFLGALPQPTVVGVVYSPFLENYCLVAADATLVSSIVDLLLGGRRGVGALQIDDRGFTAIELALAERMLSLLVNDLDGAFKPIAEPHFALDRIETTPRFAAIVQEASVCALAKFRIRIDQLGGRASIIIPHATLEPLRAALLSEFIGEAHGADSVWREHLASEVRSATIELRAVLAQKELSLGGVKGLKRGDTLVFPATASSGVALCAGEVTIGRGKIGRSGDRVAVRIDVAGEMRAIAAAAAAT